MTRQPWLVLLPVLLVLLAAGHWLAAPAPWQPPEPVAPVLEAPPATDSAPVPEAQATVERPLFWPSRRPLPPPKPAPEKPEPRPEPPPDPFAGWTLLGTYAAETGGAGLIIRNDQTLLRLAPGETLGGWTLEGVEGLEARFVHEDRVRRWRLEPGSRS